MVNEAGENDLPTIIIRADDLINYTKSTLPVSGRFIRFVDIIETHNTKSKELDVGKGPDHSVNKATI